MQSNQNPPGNQTPPTNQPNPAEPEKKPETAKPADEPNLIQSIANFFGIGGEKKPEGEKQAAETAKNVPIIKHKPSPIQKQERAIRGQPNYDPLTITFLTGDYQMQTLDLGFNISSISYSQSANWSDQNLNHLRVGATFTNLSTRDISIELTYFSDTHDISHLVENVAHLQEVSSTVQATTGMIPAPPLLMIECGDLKALPCVCTSFSPKYEHPLPNNKGFRFATVSLSFKLLGGKNSPNALGGPLTGTPLLDWKENTTEVERQRQAKQKITEKLLSDCLEKEAAKEVAEMLEKDQFSNVEKLKQLDPSSFIQVAAAGWISKESLKTEEIKKLLRENLAIVYAQTEDGVFATARSYRKLAKALEEGKPDDLPNSLKEGFAKNLANYELIADAIMTQNISSAATHPLFEKAENLGARQRFFDIAKCGLHLRQAQVSGQKEDSKQEKEYLDQINKILADKNTPDSKIKELFGLKAEAQVRHLRNSIPFDSKTHFIKEASRDEEGITGISMWEAYTKAKADEKKKKAEEEEKKKQEQSPTPQPAN